MGNLPLEADKKQIEKYFKKFGPVEKVWIRSVPTDAGVKMSRKAKVIQGKSLEGSKNKNAYVLYLNPESVAEAVKGANNQVFEGRHLHVTEANHIEKDFRTTVFVGNLPFDADEEEIRTFFEACGMVEYVRVIRDKYTFKSHGFCYVKFDSKEAVTKALNVSQKFKERELRISKARKSHLKGEKKA